MSNIASGVKQTSIDILSVGEKISFFLRVLILYVDNYGEGSEKATKEFFVGLGLREQKNYLSDVG